MLGNYLGIILWISVTTLKENLAFIMFIYIHYQSSKL